MKFVCSFVRLVSSVIFLLSHFFESNQAIRFFSPPIIPIHASHYLPFLLQLTWILVLVYLRHNKLSLLCGLYIVLRWTFYHNGNNIQEYYNCRISLTVNRGDCVEYYEATSIMRWINHDDLLVLLFAVIHSFKEIMLRDSNKFEILFNKKIIAIRTFFSIRIWIHHFESSYIHITYILLNILLISISLL